MAKLVDLDGLTVACERVAALWQRTTANGFPAPAAWTPVCTAAAGAPRMTGLTVCALLTVTGPVQARITVDGATVAAMPLQAGTGSLTGLVPVTGGSATAALEIRADTPLPAAGSHAAMLTVRTDVKGGMA